MTISYLQREVGTVFRHTELASLKTVHSVKEKMVFDAVLKTKVLKTCNEIQSGLMMRNVHM